jgi:DNA-binding transcriptional regulator YiaG
MTNSELKKIRTDLGLTQAGLATKIHKTKDCVTKWESGKYPIPKSMQALIKAIADGLA